MNNSGNPLFDGFTSLADDRLSKTHLGPSRNSGNRSFGTKGDDLSAVIVPPMLVGVEARNVPAVGPLVQHWNEIGHHCCPVN